MGTFANGSDVLMTVGGKAIGHCTTHTVTYDAETKERAFKPTVDKARSAGLWKGKGVTGLSISLSAEGFVYNGETEAGYPALMDMWKAGESVEVQCFERENDSTPYLVGMFVISNLEGTYPAQDDSTFSISLENDGEPSVFDTSVFRDD